MADVRFAAAAMLLRRQGGRLEVYLVRRSPELEFLGGFDAFPGGGTETTDAVGAADARLATALRELFEETGVLALAGAERVPPAARTALRKALLAGEAARWPAFVEEHGL